MGMTISKQSAATRDVPVLDFIVALRCALGLDPLDPSPTGAVLPPMPLDLVVVAVDLHAWISWAVGCLPLFAGGLPTGSWARMEEARVLVALAMVKGGTISRAARLLDTSRSRLRAVLKDMGMHPWDAAVARLHDPDAAGTYASQAGVIENGTVGIVRFRFEPLEHGPACLHRGERVEPLWQGRRVHVQVAYAYACRFGHVFEAKGGADDCAGESGAK
jgi:hypothetical protein